MGGALAVHLSYEVPNSGLVVIDVVEGTAIEALPAMEVLLRGRPEHFRTLNSAVEWAVKTSYIKNIDSARYELIKFWKWFKLLLEFQCRTKLSVSIRSR